MSHKYINLKDKVDFKFLKEAGVLGISNILNALSNGLIIIQLNKYIASDEAGAFLYLLAVASPIFIFLSFDLRRKITIQQLDGLNLKEFLSLRNYMAILAFFIFSTSVLILTSFSIVVLLALLAIGIGKIFDMLTETNHAFFQTHNFEHKILISRLFKLFLSGIAFFIGDNNNYITLFSIYTILNILPFLVLDIKILKLIIPNISIGVFQISYDKMKKFIFINLNLAFASLVMVVTPNVPTYFIKYFMNFSNVTYFTSINFILQALYVGGSAGLGYAMLKKFRTQTNIDGKKQLSLILRTSIMSLITYTIFGFVFYYLNGLVLLFGNNYENFYDLFLILLYSGFLFSISTYLNNYLLYKNLKKLVFRLRLVRIFTIILLCFIFPYNSLTMNSFGYALLFTNLIDSILHIIFIRINYGHNNLIILPNK